MWPSRGERPEQLYLDLGRWTVSVMTIGVTIVFVLVVGMLANSARKSNDRAEDWRRRAVVAEEAVGGLRIVIADRSTALNQRTRQANALIATLASNRGALRTSRSSVGTLTRRQRQLTSDNARAEAARRVLEEQRSALISAASALSACSRALETVVENARGGRPKAVVAKANPQLAQCDGARARLEAVLEQVG